MLSLTHRRFENYSNAISDWEVFKVDTASVTRAKINDLSSHFRVERDSSLLDVFDELINYVVCKQILAHMYSANFRENKYV